MNRDIESVIDDAVALISSLNSSSTDSIPSYNVDAMKKCITNINKLYKKNADDLMILKSGSISEKSRKQEVVLTAHARQSCIEYIKRCCCTYLHERMLRIKHLRWKHGGHIPEKIKVNHLVDLFSGLCDFGFHWSKFYAYFKISYNNIFRGFLVAKKEERMNME
ncbi:unnamed protein product [Onchocerca flexuosa]|uniref:DNA replication complex GINS protein PSF1 n=1 Tax=Onchocerca flexuosa TaxID=387005 RepID=A0A183HKC9_9BILA|nr:unnamed protein product [Onchocerca flexuosa]